MAESGQISRIWNRWKADARDDCFETGADDMGLGIKNVFTAWLVLAGLAILACIIAVIEYYYYKKIGSKKVVPEKPTEENVEDNGLQDSWISATSSNSYEKKKTATKSALAKEWFEFAFGQN